MEAPDKIWINTDTLNGYHISNHPLYGEEYIRKNALLEWFNDNIKPLNVLFGEIFVSRVKDKLKSL